MHAPVPLVQKGSVLGHFKGSAAFKKKKAVEELTLRILLAINLGCTVYSILLSDEQ